MTNSIHVREKKATHILHFDVDEVLVPEVSYSDFFDQISRLKIGESLVAKWAQLFSKVETFLNSTTTRLFAISLFIGATSA